MPLASGHEDITHYEKHILFRFIYKHFVDDCVMYNVLYEVYYSYELMVTSRKCFSPNSQGIFKRVKFIILEKMLTTRRYEMGMVGK